MLKRTLNNLIWLSLITVIFLCALTYTGVRDDVIKDSYVTSYSPRSNAIEAELEAYTGSSENVRNSKMVRKADTSSILPVYLDGIQINDELDQIQNTSEKGPIVRFPTEMRKVKNCPSSLRFTQDHFTYFQNFSHRHPKSMLQYFEPHDKPPIVILTPVSTASKHLERFFSNICSLTYPHSQISIVLGEDSSEDDTYKSAVRYLTKLKPHFRDVKIFHLKRTPTPYPYSQRHDEAYQIKRRGHLARARNQLLTAGLHDESWVLWLDSDVAYIPPDLIEQLMSAKKDIVVPACVYKKPDGTVDIYDKNTWKETEEARNFMRKHPKEYLMLEGYGQTMRLYLDSLREPGHKVVEIDGVGGCALLVKADAHRDGLIFPPFVYDHVIETEALGRMAQDMGLKLYGMPYVEVFHD